MHDGHVCPGRAAKGAVLWHWDFSFGALTVGACCRLRRSRGGLHLAGFAPAIDHTIAAGHDVPWV